MASWGGFMTRVNAAIVAFREPSIVTGILNNEDYGDFDARLLRYSVYWAYYENTQFREISKIHSWVTRNKTAHGLYRHIRSIYNPAARLGDFWQTHLMGGLLDPQAGDGILPASALPIITENERLRPAISEIWKWSNWNRKKDLYTLYGSTMGDAALRVVDNAQKGRVYLEVVHPATIQDIVKDDFGNVKAYCLQENRLHPESGQSVVYTEKCYRKPDSDMIVYKTYLNGALYPWNGERAEWREDYGFVPFVHNPHIDMGDITGGWGWPEMHKGRLEFNEICDLASKLHDQIRKTVDVPWVFLGAKANEVTKIEQTASSTDRPQPGREDVPLLSVSAANAKMQAMVADLDIGAVSEAIQNLLRDIERNYPELQFDMFATGDPSGRALEVSREPVERKVKGRRVGYDHALVRAQQMAIAIAGARGYSPDVFGAFNLGSYERGDLEHHIGDRPVFSTGRYSELEQSRIFWEAAARAVEKTGVRLDAFMRLNGFSEEQIRMVTRMDRIAQANDIRRAARNGAQPAQPTDETGTETAETEIETETEEIIEER